MTQLRLLRVHKLRKWRKFQSVCKEAQEQLREERDGQRQADGQLARSGSQLGSALMETARATEMAKEARTSMGQLQDRMHAQEAAAAQLRRWIMPSSSKRGWQGAPVMLRQEQLVQTLRKMSSMPRGRSSEWCGRSWT